MSLLSGLCFVSRGVGVVWGGGGGGGGGWGGGGGGGGALGAGVGGGGGGGGGRGGGVLYYITAMRETVNGLYSWSGMSWDLYHLLRSSGIGIKPCSYCAG